MVAAHQARAGVAGALADERPAAMAAGIVERAHSLVGPAHEQYRFGELVEEEVVARLRQLVGMCDEEPALAEDVRTLRGEEARVAVTRGGNRQARESFGVDAALAFLGGTLGDLLDQGGHFLGGVLPNYL